MKTLKAICATTILALSLSISVVAGDSHSPGKPNPVPPPAVSGGPEAIGTTSTVTDDSSFLTLMDIVWALASLY